MSWLYSRALVAEYSAGKCSDGEPSAQWSVMPMPLEFLSRVKTMEALNRSLSGQMYAPLTESLGAELLMSFQEASRARTLVQPEKAQVSPAIDQDYGKSLPGLLARYDPVTSLWKTAQCSLFEGLEQSLVTWPRSGSMRNGVCYQRPMLEPCTLERESGLWPTPTLCGNHNYPGASKTSGMGLASAVKLWQTPVANDAANRSKGLWSGRGEPKLSAQVILYPTPTASSDAAGRPGSKMQKMLGNCPAVRESGDGMLNPTWVEWLMGWPLGWTDLKPSVTVKYRFALPRRGSFLRSAQGLSEVAT
jgi:hypothetical protein